MFKEVKEMVRSGMKPRAAIAEALAKKRKMMAQGGMIDASDASAMDEGSPAIPADDTMNDDGGSSENVEQKQRSIDEIARQGRFQEESIASPAQESRDMMLAKALGESNFAMGGLVEDEFEDGVNGNEPSEDMDMSAPKPAEPAPEGLSEAMMMEIAERKKKRRYM